METTLSQPPAARANLGSRLASLARDALAAANWKNQKPKSRNQKPSAPLALTTIIRPQVRERWLLPQVAAITPAYIEMTLRGTLAGAHVPQWELFNLMEDTWPRLRKNVLELKMAVRSRRPVFEAYRDEDEEESPTATERMKLVSAALRQMQPDPAADEGAFDDLVTDILDAWFKGVSVLEIDWHVAQTRALGRFVAPRAARWISPVHYAWDGNLRLGLADDTEQSLTPFPADRFLIAQCKTKSGSVLGGALLRPLVWWWCAANFSADWLLNLAQIFGLPVRWATYDPTAPQATIDQISAMLQNMGSASWGAFPSGTTLEVKAEGQKSGSATPQGDLLDRADKQCDLLVLGQTLTTDTGGMGQGGGSHALGQVHADVRSGLIAAAAKFAARVIEQQLIPSILRLNYGDTDEAPTLAFHERTEDDLTARAQWIATLTTAGAGSIIPLDWLGKTFGIPKPKAEEATLADAKQGTAAASNFHRLTSSPDHPNDGSGAARLGNTHDRLTAGNPWHDHLGRFTFGPGGSAGPSGPLDEPGTATTPSNSTDPEVKNAALEQAWKVSREMRNPNEIVIPPNVKVIALYNGASLGDGITKANGKLFVSAVNKYASTSDIAIDISKQTWRGLYAKALSNYWYAPVWVFVFDHGKYASQAFGPDTLSPANPTLWNILTQKDNAVLFHLFGCNTGAHYYGDPASEYNSLTRQKRIIVQMSESPYNYVLGQKYFPSTGGPLRIFPEK